MTTEFRAAWSLALALSLLGCSNDDWIYRPRDVSTDLDSDVPTDSTAADVGSMRDALPAVDVGNLPDGARIDAGTTGVDAAAVADGGVRDGGMATPDLGTTDSGVAPSGLALRAQGFASVSAAPGAGTLRLTETGFEFGARECAGTLCLVGGLVP